MNAITWAAAQIGKPWAADGEGPDRYSCWGLVRAAFRELHGIDMPHVAVATPEESQVMAIKSAARVSHWRPASGRREDGDIVLMRNRRKIHCGLVLRANGHLGVLHASHNAGVRFEKWDDAIVGMSPELWRRHAIS